jgi:hypothetical protein
MLCNGHYDFYNGVNLWKKQSEMPITRCRVCAGFQVIYIPYLHQVGHIKGVFRGIYTCSTSRCKAMMTLENISPTKRG